MRAICYTIRHFAPVSRCCYGPKISRLNGATFQINSCRQLLTQRILGLDKFANAVKIGEKKLGKSAEEFKTRLVESLDDPEVVLMTQDCLSYIYLMKKEDLPNLLRLIERHSAQAAEDRDAGVLDDDPKLAGHALRICHLLGDADVALKVYNAYVANEKDFIPSLAVLLDLLYERKRYVECTDIALAKITSKHKLTRQRLQPLLTVAFLASLHMKSHDGLTKCSKLNKKWEEMGGSNASYARWLFIEYCIQQGSTNAALKLLKTKPSTVTDTVIAHNLTALAYIKSGTVLYAFNSIIELEQFLNRIEKKSKTQKKQIMLFTNIFQTLLREASRKNHIELMHRVRAQRLDMVQTKSLHTYLVNKLTRHYIKQTDHTRGFPVFDEPADESAFTQYLDLTEVNEESSEPVEYKEEDRIDSNVIPVDKVSKKPKKATKMQFVNGYVTFVEDEVTEPPTDSES